MAHRRRRQRSLPENIDRHPPNMDQLTFKYMMWKVESSTGSDSETSPRWSDTSTMGCTSSAPENGTSQRALPLTHKPAGRHGSYSLCLDPYDGSSEDSDESNMDVSVSMRARQQGKCGCRLLSRSRRNILHHPASVREVVKNERRDCLREQQNVLALQMKCGSDSELLVCEPNTPSSRSDRDGCKNLTEERLSGSTMHTQTMDMELQLDDPGLHLTRSSTPHPTKPQTSVKGSSFPKLGCSSERSSSLCDLGSPYKRKLSFPAAEAAESGQKKKQCVSNMEDEQEGNNSAFEPC